jgi:hypothetical protein
MCVRSDGKSDSSGGGGEWVGATAAVKIEKNVVVEPGGAGDGFVPVVMTVSDVKVRVVRFEGRFIGGGCRRGRREGVGGEAGRRGGRQCQRGWSRQESKGGGFRWRKNITVEKEGSRSMSEEDDYGGEKSLCWVGPMGVLVVMCLQIRFFLHLHAVSMRVKKINNDIDTWDTISIFKMLELMHMMSVLNLFALLCSS